MKYEKTAKATLALVFYIFLCNPRCALLSVLTKRRDFFDLPHTRNRFDTEQEILHDSALPKSSG